MRKINILIKKVIYKMKIKKVIVDVENGKYYTGRYWSVDEKDSWSLNWSDAETFKDEVEVLKILESENLEIKGFFYDYLCLEIRTLYLNK